MMNAKQTMLTAAMMCLFSAVTVMAKEAPKEPQALELTPQQWEMLKNMKPEQQKMAFRQGVKQNMIKDKMAALTPEQKLEVENFIKDEMEHRRNMKERMNKMTKPQKEALHLQLPKPPQPRAKMHGPKQHHHQAPMMQPPCHDRFN